MALAQARQAHLAFHREQVRAKAARLNRGGQGGLDPYGSAAEKGKYNTAHGFDAGLDALRSGGLDQKQFSNLQAGRLPGGMHGGFLGMSPAQLKQVASFVNAQGTMTPEGAINPITGQQDSQMHFAYNDPRIGHGETADEQASVLPWMQQQPGGFHPPRLPDHGHGPGFSGGPFHPMPPMHGGFTDPRGGHRLPQMGQFPIRPGGPRDWLGGRPIFPHPGGGYGFQGGQPPMFGGGFPGRPPQRGGPMPYRPPVGGPGFGGMMGGTM